MNKLGIDDLVYKNITISVSDVSEGIKISFIGSIDMEYPQKELDAYFDYIHEAVLKKNIKNVFCDFQKLGYINSRGIRCLVRWIMQNTEAAAFKFQYHFIFIISKDYRWQKTSLGFLTTLSPEFIHVQE